MIINWIDITTIALVNFWQGFLGFLPSLIGAIIFFIFGYFIAVWVGRIIAKILRKLKINNVFEKGTWKEALEKADLKADIAGFLGIITQWILVVVTLKISVEILGWFTFAMFLEDIVAYLPRIFVAALIFVVAAIIADIVEKIVKAGVEGIKTGYGRTIGVILKWSIWVFAALAILHQLGIAAVFMETIFFGIVAMLAIAFGLAFGFGGKDVAAEILQDLKRELKEK